MNSNRIRSFTDLNFSPFLLNSGTARIPDLNSETGKHVCPAKSSFSEMSYSCTSIRSTASSGTVNGNINSSSQSGAQLSSIVLVFFFISSAGTPAIATWRQTCQWGGHEGICFASSKLFPRASFSSYILNFFFGYSMDKWWEEYNQTYTPRDRSLGDYKGETPLCHWGTSPYIYNIWSFNLVKDYSMAEFVQIKNIEIRKFLDSTTPDLLSTKRNRDQPHTNSYDHSYLYIKVWWGVCIEVCVMKVQTPSITHIHSHLQSSDITHGSSN